jgi:hypothetical protein
MWATDHYRTRDRAACRARREKRRARGDCQRCGRRRVHGKFKTCLSCRLKLRAYHEAHKMSQDVLMPSTKMSFVTGSKADIHVRPINDLRAHVEARDCWCKPELEPAHDGVVLVVHNAADECELVEEHGIN